MTPPSDKKGGTPKPFLAEDELSTELDAWDDMFDHLHGGPEATDEPPMQSPQSQAPPAEAAPASARTAPQANRADAQRSSANDLPEWSEQDLESGETLIARAEAQTKRRPLGAPPVDMEHVEEEEEDVYTSASRPNLKGARSDRAESEDPVAPPPPPAARRRTGPAIIRRTPVSIPALAPKPKQGSAIPEREAGSQARVGNVGQGEARSAESRRADARSKAPTAPPPMSFTPAVYDEPKPAADDDYEIEIDASDGEAPDAAAAPSPSPAPPPRRRTVAHVVRRNVDTQQPRARPPAAPATKAAPPVTGSRTEADFSDVAAAVGAADDMIDDQLPTSSTHDAIEIEVESDAYGAVEASDDSLEVPVEGAVEPLLDPAASGTAQQPRDVYEIAMPRQGVESGLPLGIDRGSDAPPADLADLYPRVKRPTSVPMIGKPAFEEHTVAADTAALAPLRKASREDMPAPAYGEELPDIEPIIDLEAVGPDSEWPEQLQPLPSANLAEDAASMLVVYEREIPTIDDPTASAALRVEAGRLCEWLGHTERARGHYDAALLADPRATAALRGLRRVARAHGDLGEATRHLEAEIAVAGPLERGPLAHYRVSLLFASGEHDLARVAVGELLDSSPSDVGALLAQVELAFLDGRAEEFGAALERLANAVTDNELRAVVQQARGMLAAHHNDPAAAATWFSAAVASDPGSLAARLGALRDAVAQSNGEAAAQALLELARIVESNDPATAAAFAIRAQHWATGATATAAAQLGMATMASDALVARVAAETALATGDGATTALAMTAWANSSAPVAERAYAAARAAELEPGRSAELWNHVLELDPGDDYAAAQLRTAYVAAEQTQQAIEVDLAVAEDPDRERARLRAAFGMIAEGQLDSAIAVLQQGHDQRPTSIAMGEALAEALAAAGRWTERAKLLAKIAAEPGELIDRDVAQLRCALAWEEAVGAAAAAEAIDADEVQHATTSALAAWEKVIDQVPGGAPTAHAAAIVLATRIGESAVTSEVLARAQSAERSPWAASSLGLRRARLAADDPARVDLILNEPTQIDDPRRTVGLLVAAARRNDLTDAATTLDERAAQLGDTSEAAALRLRSAQLFLDAGDAGRATGLLRRVEHALPGVPSITDLWLSARRRSGDASGAVRMPKEASGAAGADEFARIVRDADDAAARGDTATALGMYQSALEMRPGDPLAAVPLVRVATQLREPEPIAALALAQLRAAEAAGDGASKAEAYELLAHIDKELRNDTGSAQIALESASQADPTRIDLMQGREREYTVGDQIGDLLRLRRAELAQISADLPRDRAALLMDTAGLAERDQRPDAELTELYRDALTADSRHRLALFHHEAIVRRAGASEELAGLEDQIAWYFDGDARTQAAFFTRAGETLAELGQIDAAVQKFGKAEAASPGHVPALEGWRQAALRGQLWTDVADAAARQANASGDAEARAALHHFAGVVLMDKAMVGDQATAAFRRALDADPSHRDAFIRLRILLEEDANHDELAILLEKRLEHEPDEAGRVEIHRALANLMRNFLSDREGAKRHYREIMAADPNDLGAHAAIADIAWEQGQWQEAADALIARARLEHDPDVLKTLCFRLGLIYADRLVDVPMALKAFQRALTYQPDDEVTLARLADLATQAGEWKLALGACERLVKTETDPDKRAYHLHRVARIFRQGFGDMKRAERALNLALDSAPTNDDALSELVKFYRDAGDMTSVRVHLNRVAGTMRVRAANDPRDGVAYRVISRAMAARAGVGVDGSLPLARAAAELAQLLGAAGEAELMLLAEQRRFDLAPLLRPEADEVLFPRTVQTELRQMFKLMGDRVAKHVGLDLRAYGVGRGDRLRARDSSVASHAQDVATGLGFGEIDVYVSTRQPFAMVAEPTSPVSLVIGQGIAQATGDGGRGVRFAAGTALKLAQTHVAIAARLPAEELGMLVIALMRLFQPEFPAQDLDEAAITTHMQKLKRLIPTGLASELRPFAFAIDANAFSYPDVARDLRVAGLRAGLVAAGSLVAGLKILAAQARETVEQASKPGDADHNVDVASFLATPLAQGLISFALSEDHATITR